MIAVTLLIRFLTREPEYRGRSLSAWAADLRSGDAAVRKEAEQVFRESPHAIEFLTRRITSDSGPVQRASTLVAQHLPDSIKRPLRRLYDPGQKLLDKHLAAQALQQLGTNAQSAIPALGKLLRDSNVLLAGSAGMTLGRMGPAAVPVLIEALDDPDFNVRSSACAALSQLTTNAAPAVPRLISILEGESGPIVSSAAYTLSQIRAPAVPALTSLLVSTNWPTRRWAAYSLACIGPDADRAIPSLVQAAKDENLQVRWAAVDALARISRTSQSGNAALLDALGDPDQNVRGVAMAEIATRPGVIRHNQERIATLLQDESPLVRSNAALALESMKR